MIKGANGLVGAQEHIVIYTEQVKHLYRLCTIGIATTLVNSFLLIFVLRKVISHTASINWITAMLLISLAQYVLQQKYENEGIIKNGQNKWGRLFIVGAALSGLFWGASAIFLFPTESIIHQLLLALLSCAMLAVAMGVYSVLMDAFLVYSIPAILPIIIRFTSIGDEVHLTMGGVILIFSLLMFFAAKGINNSLKTSLTLKQTYSKSVSHLKAREGTVHVPYRKQKRKADEGYEEQEKRKKAQWMTGFEQFKKQIRESSGEAVNLKVPKSRAPRPRRLPSRPTILKDITRDFSNLFTYIQGKVSLSLMEMRPDHPGYAKLKDVEKSVLKGAELTKLLAKISGAPRVGKKTIDLNKLIRQKAQAFGRENKQVAVHLRIQDRIWDVHGDEKDLERVIRRIYDDSCRGISGGGDLYIRTQNVTLGEAFMAPYGLKPGKFVKISVTSIGSGLDELGLEISREEPAWVRELIRKNGGILDTYRDGGRETTLDLYIPAKHHESEKKNR